MQCKLLEVLIVLTICSQHFNKSREKLNSQLLFIALQQYSLSKRFQPEWSFMVFCQEKLAGKQKQNQRSYKLSCLKFDPRIVCSFQGYKPWALRVHSDYYKLVDHSTSSSYKSLTLELVLIKLGMSTGLVPNKNRIGPNKIRRFGLIFEIKWFNMKTTKQILFWFGFGLGV